jgi:hypothetical protein
MIFPAPSIDRATLDSAARVSGARPLDLVASDGTALYAWHRPSEGRRLVIYFGGNGESVASNTPLQRMLTDAGFDVFALAYRGYPGSAGSPSEAGLVLDAQAAWDWARGQGFDPERIVVHGRSLGGGVAAHLAEDRDPAALILESTFASITRMARRTAPVYPLGLLLRNPFDTEGRAAAIRAPTFVVHSHDDEVIPFSASVVQVRDRFREVEVHETRGFGHNQCTVVDDPPIRAAYLAYLARTVP